MADNVAPPELGSGNFEMPSMDQIMELVKQMNLTSDEEAELMRSLTNGPAFKSAGKQVMAATGSDYMIFVFMFLLVGTVFAFFGYKLYKSVIQKEQKRQEKLKAKQEKKSKKNK